MRSSVETALAERAAKQGGLLSRQQVLAAGGSDEWIRAQLAARRWRRVYDGVFATFTGPLPWLSRAWAAVLVAGPGAALGGEAALVAAGMRRDTNSVAIRVNVPHGRHLHPPPGVDVRYRRHLARMVHPTASPPRLRFEVAVLERASEQATLGGAIGLIADACQQRLTTPGRLRDALAVKPRLRWRRALVTVIDDVGCGAYSYLEVQYLRAVERPHALPTATRQRKVTTGRSTYYRDVEYVSYGVVVELDGRLGHESEIDRSADMERDNRSTSDAVTLRFGYRKIIDTPCEAAGAVGAALRRRGWRGTPRRCGPGCRLRC